MSVSGKKAERKNLETIEAKDIWDKSCTESWNHVFNAQYIFITGFVF